MKTTIEISDALMGQARRLAARENTTLHALVEQGLRIVIADKGQSTDFRMRRASFKGKGLQTPLQDAGWERLRDIVYEGRGGHRCEVPPFPRAGEDWGEGINTCKPDESGK